MPHMPRADTPVAHRVSLIGINLPTYIELSEGDVEHIGVNLTDAVAELGELAQ